ncbi:hypothetical protein [Abyssisolibacter fermentans]|uniref:hypothetical protein n=1 Tax=Abyssisolibacter fermentans TaxID=1766203 RepID=UPI0008376358|nr:hypothetical protein [Abyssisolibacter fermentans]
MTITELNNLATDKVMSLAELKEDNIYRKIPHNMQKLYVSESMKIGVGTANLIKEKYNDADIKSICSDKGITIKFIDKIPKLKFIKIRADYSHQEKCLNIYNSSIEEMYKQFNKIDMGFKLNVDDIINIHIAHELYHYLEYEEIGLTNEILPKITLFKFGSIERKSTVVKTREIAAHMFCRKMLNLSVHPKWIDYIYLLAASEIKYKDLKEYLLNLKEEK